MKISDIIIVVLFIISIATAAWYLFGDSPTFEQTLLVFVLTALFTIGIKITSINMRLRFLERSFRSLASDFKQHK